jgi:hypothetical protein
VFVRKLPQPGDRANQEDKDIAWNQIGLMEDPKHIGHRGHSQGPRSEWEMLNPSLKMPTSCLTRHESKSNGSPFPRDSAASQSIARDFVEIRNIEQSMK